MATRPNSKRTEQKSRNRRKPTFNNELATKCERLIGARVTDMEFPGGNSRDSVRLLLKKGAPVYVSTRSRKRKADVERVVLKTVSRAGANVPQLLGSDGHKMLIQEEIPGDRLSQVIHKRSDKTVLQYLDNALDSLAKIQQVGSENGLDEKLPRLGDTHEWLVGLLGQPAVLGRFFDIPAPRPELKQLENLLAIRKSRFVKWDSRPGNAIAKSDGQVYWIDWEHSGTRNRLDDMVWLLADEFVPNLPKVEDELLDKFLPAFSDDLSIDQARKYFYAFGVFHLTIRMGLIFKYKKDASWWSYEKCLARDKAGVTLKNAMRLCKRGERWAAINPETLVLSAWFKEMEAKISKT